MRAARSIFSNGLSTSVLIKSNQLYLHRVYFSKVAVPKIEAKYGVKKTLSLRPDELKSKLESIAGDNLSNEFVEREGNKIIQWFQGLPDEEKKKQLEGYLGQIKDVGTEYEDYLASHVAAEHRDPNKKPPTDFKYVEPVYPLPVIEHHVPREYPMLLSLQCHLPDDDVQFDPMASNERFPMHKAKLTINHAHLRRFISKEQEKFFIALVGCRYNAKKQQTIFVSRELPSDMGNYNRVFQLFDATLWESRKLLEESKASSASSGSSQLQAELNKHSSNPNPEPGDLIRKPPRKKYTRKNKSKQLNQSEASSNSNEVYATKDKSLKKSRSEKETSK